jgi:hypothetical protein
MTLMGDHEDDDDVVMLTPEEIEKLPEIQQWKLATKKVLEHVEADWVIRFLRNFADHLEATIDSK